MADYQTARAAGIAAVDELDTWQVQPTLSSQLASVAALETQVTALTAANNARQVAIDNMKAAAEAEKAADAASVAGQGVLDAAGPF